MAPISSRFGDFATISTSLGQIFGLVGMTLFSINLILAGRFKFLDKYFNGLDKVYKNHSKIGSIAFSMILFHPIFLVIQYLSMSTKAAALFFVPFINMPITWGIISLFLMIVLISFTFYIKLKYHIWKMSHKFMVLAFAFGVIHTLTISSDISRNYLLRSYIFLLAFAGLVVSIRQAFLSKLLVKKLKYKVVGVNQLNTDVVEIEMEPIDEGMSFTPGQFAFFSFLSKGVTSEFHPFSISSSNKGTTLKITVKNLGDYTSLLKNLNKNDEVLVDGPYGHFSYQNVSSKNQIWIAGGIGITPFYSMAQNLDKGYNVNFYYSIKEEKEAVYTRELQDISDRNPNFKFNIWNAKDKGYINGKVIGDLSGGVEGKDIFFCGPPIFMENLKNQFTSLGVNSEKIHYENFSFN
jgi:predicted ferric reductase